MLEDKPEREIKTESDLLSLITDSIGRQKLIKFRLTEKPGDLISLIMAKFLEKVYNEYIGVDKQVAFNIFNRVYLFALVHYLDEGVAPSEVSWYGDIYRDLAKWYNEGETLTKHNRYIIIDNVVDAMLREGTIYKIPIMSM